MEIEPLSHLGVMEAEQEHFQKLRGHHMWSQLMIQGCVNGFQLKTVKTS